MSSVDYVRAPRVWGSLGGSRTAGHGVTVGILDTGIWPEHPMLQDRVAAPRRAVQLPVRRRKRHGSPRADVRLQPQAHRALRAYGHTYLASTGRRPGEFCDVPAGTCSPRDADGHGTHTATTAAGSPVSHALLMGVDRGPVSGCRPRLRHRLSRLPGPGLLPLRLGRGRPAGDPRRRQRHQLLDQRRL